MFWENAYGNSVNCFAGVRVYEHPFLSFFMGAEFGEESAVTRFGIFALLESRAWLYSNSSQQRC
jgi:hypothetical protein